jgi:hypothetical protein
MGKNREGNYIPPKGKPSAEGRSKAEVKTVPHLDNLEQHDEIADKYTEGPDQPAANVRVMNPNRNPNKEDYDNTSYS